MADTNEWRDKIRYISGHFYVYEISSRWDPAKGKNIYLVREHYYARESRLSDVPQKDQELLKSLGVKLF